MRVVLLLALLLAGCDLGPSCAERGGKKVKTGNTPVFTGKVLVLVPQYRCEMPE